MTKIQAANFEMEIEKTDVKLIWLNQGKLQVALSNYGARILQLFYEDVNVVVGFNDLSTYFIPPRIYHGATIGRFANRIKHGTFSLNGVKYNLRINNAPNHLHGGPTGFHDRVWEVMDQTENSVLFFYLSPDGEEGYPGNLSVSTRFTLSDESNLTIEYQATTTHATPFNITNHAYFNLNGDGSILNHQLQIHAQHFTPVTQDLIPTGLLKPVKDSPFDFTSFKTIGSDIDSSNDQIKIGNGYDHNFVLNKPKEGAFAIAATAIGDTSGIVMQVATDQPALQLFSGNFEIDGKPETYRSSFCLETQQFPDAPNQPQFPSAILEPGTQFHSKTSLQFSRSKV